MSKPKNSLDELKSMLREHGLRATPARISVLGFLQGATRPLTHLDLTEALVDRGFEKSTIFRALADLSEVKLLRKLELGDHVWRFELVSGKNGETHPHLLCVDCGSVQCLSDGQVQLKTSRLLGEIEEVLIKGHCRECR